MKTRYRLFSEAFGEYLENMAIGLIDKFIHYLSTSSSTRNHTYSFNVGWECTNGYGSNRVYIIEVYDGTTKEDLIRFLNKAYVMYFDPLNYDGNVNQIFLDISFEDYSWDKYNKTFLPVLKIHDQYFYQFHERTIDYRIRR